MIYDSITVAEGSSIKNLVTDSGGSFPTSPDIGEFFYKTGVNTLYIYTPTGWDGIMSSSYTAAVTIGTTTIPLSQSTLTLGGLSVVTSASFVGALTGNASSASIASHIAGGSVGYLPIQVGVNSTGLIPPGQAGYVLTSTGAGSLPSWQLGGGVAESLTGSNLATNIIGSSLQTVGTIVSGAWQGSTVGSSYGGTGQSTYATGDMLYASSINTLSKLPAGNNGQILTMNGGTPAWESPGSTTSAGWLVGGSAGTLVYQSAVDTTTYLSVGSDGQVLTLSNGLPSWQNANVGTISTVNGTTNQIVSLTTGSTVTLSLPSNVTITGTMTANSFSGSGAGLTGTAPNLVVGSVANLEGGAAGYLPYQTAVDTTSFIAAGTSGYVLTSSGAGQAPSWQPAASASGSITIGSTAIALGSSATTLAGLTSVNSVTFSATTVTASSGMTINGNAVGYLGVPQNAQGTYTLVLSDAGKQIFTSTGNASWTIPSNAAVAFPIGTAITFVNQSASACTISITSDTMYVVTSGVTGNRTLSAWGIATILKTSATTWMISGNTLS